MSGEPDIVITCHAYYRARQRLKWDNEKLNVTAKAAFISGKSKVDLDGPLKELLEKMGDDQANNIVVFAGIVFFFKNRTLLTVYALPKYMKNEYYKVAYGYHFKKPNK